MLALIFICDYWFVWINNKIKIDKNELVPTYSAVSTSVTCKTKNYINITYFIHVNVHNEDDIKLQ